MRKFIVIMHTVILLQLILLVHPNYDTTIAFGCNAWSVMLTCVMLTQNSETFCRCMSNNIYQSYRWIDELKTPLSKQTTLLQNKSNIEPTEVTALMLFHGAPDNICGN